MGGRLILTVALAALALAVAVPAAGATSVYWTGSYDRGAEVQITSGEDEANDLTIVASDGNGRGRVLDVYDRLATLDDGGAGPVEPGACSGEYYHCSVPCRIESPHHARCVTDDGYGARRTLDPLDGPTFRVVFVDVRGGEDRVLVPRTTAKPVVAIEGGDGGNSYTLAGADGYVEASKDDTVTFLPGSSGGVRIWGGGVTVNAVDGAEEWIDCWYEPGEAPKLYLDPLDRPHAYCPDPVVPPKLPSP